ncbi:hypothetical protein EJ110_NYTH42653 [Nymphaea thermarum]|nr:hypothetical protein EJ110_NYTH42653 [Nymphaea thermarum]
MGDYQAWGQPNGGLAEENPGSANPNPSAITRDGWNRAEDRALEIICRIQPTAVSEMRRKAVVDYMQGLLRGCLGAEVFPFGSVPLKTYLPDGDIDLSAFSPFHNVEDALANDVRIVLEGEEQNKASEFEVRDVQYIHAEVKLVKCLVQNIVALDDMLLTQVDRLIAKEHLFKRSIILIKAWCYYESRILGAHHGLISTYALETLVLYIFHHFYSSLHGPLEVLYRFLDYFSKFDWDKYCVSLNGPVPISSLPELTGKKWPSDMQLCLDAMSHGHSWKGVVPVSTLDRSTGNFYRIRSAFTYGARKLGRILLSPDEVISKEINKFFMNTLDRHGSGQRPDVQDPNPNFLETPSFGVSAYGAVSNFDPEGYMEDQFSQMISIETSSAAAEESSDSCSTLCDGTAKLKIQDQEGDSDTKLQRGSKSFNLQSLSHNSYKMGHNSMISEFDESVGGTTVSGSCLVGDAKDLTISRMMVPSSRKEIDTASINESCASSSGRVPDRFTRSNTYPGKMATAHLDQCGAFHSNVFKKVSSLQQMSNEQVFLSSGGTKKSIFVVSDAPQPCTSSESSYGFLLPDLGSYPSDDIVCQTSQSEAIFSGGMVPCTGDVDNDAGLRIGAAGDYEAVNHLSDLIGDFESHMQSLNQRMYKERQPSGRGRYNVMPNHMSQRPRNNGRAAFSPSDMNLTGRSIDSGLQEKANSESPRQETSNSSYPAFSAPNATGWSRVASPATGPVYPSGNGRGKLVTAEVPSSRPIMRYLSTTNGLPPSTEGLEFGTLGPLPWSSLNREQNRKQEPASGDMLPISSAQRPVLGVNQERFGTIINFPVSNVGLGIRAGHQFWASGQTSTRYPVPSPVGPGSGPGKPGPGPDGAAQPGLARLRHPPSPVSPMIQAKPS